jgi:hypothetical protein
MLHDGVNSGVVPVKLRTGAHREELQRCQLLVSSLAKHWKGAQPFQLHVVCLDGEVDEVHAGLGDARTPAVELCMHRESELFPGDSAFFATHGTYKQQLVKIRAPVAFGLGGFITFDADVMCLRDFDESTFVADGRLISTWEPKTIHSWWENGCIGCGLATDMAAPGLGVTPNVLHSDLCAELLAFLERRGLAPIEHLCWLTKHHPDIKTYAHEGGHPLVWSEYSLYDMAAKAAGRFFEYHLTPAEVDRLAVRIHSRRNVWGESSVDRLRPDGDDPGYFIVVQSWAGVRVADIPGRLGLG